MPSMKLHFPLQKAKGEELCFMNDDYVVVFDGNNKKQAGRKRTKKEWKSIFTVYLKLCICRL